MKAQSFPRRGRQGDETHSAHAALAGIQFYAQGTDKQ